MTRPVSNPSIVQDWWDRNLHTPACELALYRCATDAIGIVVSMLGSELWLSHLLSESEVESPSLNSYSASHDNWCTATLWNWIITAQCEGMGEVGSARYEPALLPPCPSIRALSYSNCTLRWLVFKSQMVAAGIHNRNGVPQQFGSCLKWRSRANKPSREWCLIVWKMKMK